MPFGFIVLANVVAIFALAPAGPGQLANVAAIASTGTDKPTRVGEDVIRASQRWLRGDEGGKSDLEALALNGRSDAQEMLGEILGFGGPPQLRDEIKACGWFAKAAGLRSDAMHNLAFCAEKGVGGAPDTAHAVVLYRKAAQRGYPKSMCALGNLYVSGRGVPKDEARGAALCRQGAELGEPDAQTDLGNLYLKGVGVPRNIVEARRWYEQAAAQHQPNAQFTLGQIYWNGDGVARDRSKAAELWKAAYEGGRVDAAPLLASWLFANWTSAHNKGDLAVLDQAIRYGEAAVMISSEDKRVSQQSLLSVMRAARATGEKE